MRMTRAKLEADLARMIADNGETLNYNGNDFAVEADEAALEFAPEFESLISGDSVAVVMVNSSTGSLPGKNAIVNFREEEWRVQRFRVSVDQVGRVLVLGPVMGD